MMKNKTYRINRGFFSDSEWYDIISCKLELPSKGIVLNEDGSINPEYLEYFNLDEIVLEHNKVCLSDYYVLCEFLLHYIANDMFSEAIHLFIDETDYLNFECKGDNEELGFIINIYDEDWDQVIKTKKIYFSDYE